MAQHNISTFCLIKDKIRYETWAEATEMLRVLKKTPSKKMLAQDCKRAESSNRGWYLYWCSECQGYHHTSTSPKQPRVKRYLFKIEPVQVNSKHVEMAYRILSHRSRPFKTYKKAA